MGWNSAPALRGHLAAHRSFVVVGAVEGQREGADRIAMMARGEAEHGAGIEAAAEIAADRHIGAQPEANRLFQRVPKLGRHSRHRSADGRVALRAGIIEVPVAGELDVPFGGEQIVARRHLEDAVEERAHLVAAELDGVLRPTRHPSARARLRRRGP